MDETKRVNAHIIISGDSRGYNQRFTRNFLRRCLQQKGFVFSEQRGKKDGKRIDRFIIEPSKLQPRTWPVISVFPKQSYEVWAEGLDDSQLPVYLIGAERIALFRGRKPGEASDVYCAADVWTMANHFDDWITYTQSWDRFSPKGLIKTAFDNGEKLITPPTNYHDFNEQMVRQVRVA